MLQQTGIYVSAISVPAPVTKINTENSRFAVGGSRYQLLNGSLKLNFSEWTRKCSGKVFNQNQLYFMTWSQI